jgi:hypothetical protein
MKTIDSNRKHVYRLFKPFNAFEENVLKVFRGFSDLLFERMNILIGIRHRW